MPLSGACARVRMRACSMRLRADVEYRVARRGEGLRPKGVPVPSRVAAWWACVRGARADKDGIAATQMHHVRHRRQHLLIVMRNVHERRAARTADALDQFEHAAAVGRVKALHWLVEDEDQWLRREGGTKEDELLLAL